MTRSRRSPIALLAALVLAISALSLLPAGAAHAADRDCGDFANQAAAQRFFIDAGGPSQDPHDLDRDGDGIACESLPCPCSSDQGGAPPAPAPAPQPAPAPATRTEVGEVRQVGSAGIFKVRLDSGKYERVRMLGIAVPSGRQCWSSEANAAVKRTLRVGTRVRLTSDSSQKLRDPSKRLLRYVTKAGNADVGRSLLKYGHARTHISSSNPIKRAKAYTAEQKRADQADRGLWGACG